MVPADTPIETYLRWACSAHGAPAGYHLASILAVACAELARRGFTLDHPRKPLRLWFTLIGDSASGKSSAIHMAEDFIHSAWAEAGLLFSDDSDPWVEIDGSISGLLHALWDHYDVSRGTTAALLYHHEVSSMFASREPVSEMLCRLADGSTYHRHLRELQRKKTPRDKVIRPHVSALFAATETALGVHFDEAKRSGGIFSRMWWIKPTFSKQNLQAYIDLTPTDPLRERAVDAWVGWFARLTLHQESKVVTLSELGRAQLHGPIWESLCREKFSEIETENNAVHIRLVDQVHVLGAMWALSRNSRVIEPQDLIPAVALAKLLLTYNARMSLLGMPGLFRIAERVQKALAVAGEEGLSRRQLYKVKRMDKKMLDTVLETLIDSGAVVAGFSNQRSDGRVYFDAKTEAAKELINAPGAEVVDISSRRDD